jgi:hypothetical protein
MSRLNSPDGYVSEVNIKTQSGVKRFKADKDGKYGTDDPKVISALRSQGFTDEALSPYSKGDSQRGYTCPNCGFGSWFMKCSRCERGIDGNGSPK